MVGTGDNFRLSDNLITHLREKGIALLVDASSHTDRNQRGTVWKSTQELDLTELNAQDWNVYTKQLRENFIHLGEEKDKLT